MITFKMAKEEAMRLALVYQQGGSVVDAANIRYKNHDHLPTVKERVDSYLKTYGNLLRASMLAIYRWQEAKQQTP